MQSLKGLYYQTYYYEYYCFERLFEPKLKYLYVINAGAAVAEGPHVRQVTIEYQVSINNMKLINNSCEIADFVETHLCNLCVVLQSRTDNTGFIYANGLIYHLEILTAVLRCGASSVYRSTDQIQSRKHVP